jgi:hypothetical protein
MTNAMLADSFPRECPEASMRYHWPCGEGEVDVFMTWRM